MSLPLEDNFGDVISKALRGLGLSDEALAQKSGVPLTTIRELKDGRNPSRQALAALAPILQLRNEPLQELAKNPQPPDSPEVENLYSFTTPFRDSTVNYYLVGDGATGQAALFDTGTDIQPALRVLESRDWRLAAIFLTHTHGDHVLELDLLKEKTGAPAYVSEREPFEGAESFPLDKSFQVGQLRIETRSTYGHSKGGTTYVIHGLIRPVAVVGDAIFARSMGGGGVSYADALRTNREQIYTLSPDTVLCPGHGPLTTVQDEQKANPFYREGE